MLPSHLARCQTKVAGTLSDNTLIRPILSYYDNALQCVGYNTMKKGTTEQSINNFKHLHAQFLSSETFNKCRNITWDLRFSLQCCWRFISSGVWHSVVGQVVLDVQRTAVCAKCQDLYAQWHSITSQKNSVFTNIPSIGCETTDAKTNFKTPPSRKTPTSMPSWKGHQMAAMLRHKWVILMV